MPYNPDSQRWTIRRKKSVVDRFIDGTLSKEEIKKKYDVSQDELWEWVRNYKAHGLKGLMTTVRHKE